VKLRTALLFLLIGTGACQAAAWTKYVAPDKSYSFHYPTGWSVTPGQSTVQIEDPDSGEQLLLIASPAESGQTAKDIALRLVRLLQQDVPSLQVTQWNDEGETGDFAFGTIAYTQKDKPFLGDVLVALGGGSALWFGYSAPEADYSRLRAKALLDGFISSFEGDAGSKQPEVVIPDLGAARLDRNAKAFIFVLEFGCGTAFTETQEGVVRAEVINAWRQLPAADRAQYDKYPARMKAILVLNQQDMATMQAQLKQSVAEMLAQSDTSPAMKIIRDQVNRSNEVLMTGTPPLTATAADAYAELMGFARAMTAKPAAGPEDISETIVRQARADLLKAWEAFADDDKQAVLSAPALWIAIRMTFRQGTAAEKQQVRASLKKLEAAEASPSALGANANTGNVSSELTRRQIQSQTLLMMQQQTFNTYMWSRGFSGWTPMGKTW
jgi:hypothetical protein